MFLHEIADFVANCHFFEKLWFKAVLNAGLWPGSLQIVSP